nr:SE1561 family protein [Bacillus sp. TL12]
MRYNKNNSNKKESVFVGKAIQDKDSQLVYLKERLNMFIEVIDTIEPEEVELEDVDRLLAMLDELELKCEQFKKDE